MNRTRRLLLASATGLALLAAACTSDSASTGSAGTAESTTSSVDPSSTTSSVAETSTTVAESTTTTAAPTTTAPPAPTTPATPAPTVAPPSGGTALGAPTNLQPTPGGGIILPQGDECVADPGIPGWNVQECEYMPSYNDGVMALVLRRDDDGRFGVAVMFHSGSNWVQRYWAGEESPGIWSDVRVEVGDFHFDDGAEVWVGYRYEGSGGYLDLDVLDPLPGGVFFLGGLQGLDHGQVDLHPGGATVLTAVYADSDPNCCPSSFLVREVTWASNQWRINAGTTYPAASVPAVISDF